MGQGGIEWKVRDFVNDAEFHFVRFSVSKWMLMNDLDCGYFDLYRIFNVNTI